MAKKEKIEWQRPVDLEAVETELASALEMLDDANERVEDLLRANDPPKPPPPAETPPADKEE